MPARLLILGLDGASLDLIEPWAADGTLPHIARLMRSGAWGPMRSTVPPMSFPAWTSLMTGANPGRHGVFDFSRRIPGTYQIEFTNATYRQTPTVWRLLSDAGRRVGVIGLPGTYPPEVLNGFQISGFDSPVATGIDPSFVEPPELLDEITREIGAYKMTGFQEIRIGPGWHEKALYSLHEAIGRRTEIARYLLDREMWDCFCVHFGESDTVAHHFWAFHDTASPRHDSLSARALGTAVRSVYESLDSATGALLEAAGGNATTLVVSDHGTGGTGRHVVYLNRWLARQGLLRFASKNSRGRIAAGLKDLGLSLPAVVQERVFRGPLRRWAGRVESSSRLGGIDWASTMAFSEEVNTNPGVWLNVAGREPEGIVNPGAEYESLRSTVLARLGEWRNPESQQRVIRRAWRREEVYDGPATSGAPDIVIEPATDCGYGYTFLSSKGQLGAPLRSLEPAEYLGAKGGSMNGSHRPDGIVTLAGAGIVPGSHPHQAQIVDVAPTVLCLLGEPIPRGMDGRVLDECLLTGEIRAPVAPVATQNREPKPYSAEQAAAVDQRLRGLGYRT